MLPSTRTKEVRDFPQVTTFSYGYCARNSWVCGCTIKIIFAILLPPVGVFLEVGFKGHFWLNILLTLLGYIPGIIHALYVIFKH